MYRCRSIVAALFLLAPASVGAQHVSRLRIATDDARPDSSTALNPRSGRYFAVHATLGTVALGAFGSALAIGAASGNLGKLTDRASCCPDGGTRRQPWRNVDRFLVTTGILSYLGAATLAGYNLVVRHPPAAENKGVGHKAHRWLSLAHGAVFATSAVTGGIMKRSQATDSDRFAAAARVHVAANVLLVPLLTAALTSSIFE